MNGHHLARITAGVGRDLWPLRPDRPNIIGRAAARQHEPDIDLSPDRSVSRRHARVWFAEERWWIQDTESRNGTTLDGRRLEVDTPTPCGVGVPIGVGGAQFTIAPPESRRLRHESLVIDLTVSPRFALALARCSLRPIPRVVVRNWGKVARAPALLEFSLPGVGKASIALPRLASGESVSVSELRLSLDEAELRRNYSAQWRPWSIQLDRAPIDAGGAGCTVLGGSEWSYLPEHRISLACFVKPHDPIVVSIARQATADWSLAAGGPEAMRRIYEHLSTWRIAYRRDRPPPLFGVQRLRSPTEVLWDPDRCTGEGTCVEIALLIAGALESLRLQPLLAIIDNQQSWHALVGCRRNPRGGILTMPSAVEDILGEAEWLDPNGCTRDSRLRVPFSEAVHRARRDLNEKPLVFALDIAAARASGIAPLASTLPARAGARTA